MNAEEIFDLILSNKYFKEQKDIYFMFVTEEVVRKYTTLKVKDWHKAYSELKDILERGYKFTRVQEKDFRHHKDMGRVEAKIICRKEMDKYTEVQLVIRPIFEIADDGESAQIELRTRGLVVTEYPEETSFQKSLVYITLRGIWDKLFYGWARGEWKEDAEELVEEVHADIRRFYRSL